MGLPVEVNNLMLGSLGGYTVGRSLRFRSSASAYLNRTPSSTGNRQKFTWSGWVKRGLLTTGTYYQLFGAGPTSGGNEGLFFDTTSGGLYFTPDATNAIVTSSVYRDPSAWYHIVLSVDTTQATSANREIIYVNGVQVTSYTGTYCAQNTNFNYINVASAQHRIGAHLSSGYYFDGYMAEVNFIDGQALTPSSFGAYDTNGVWQPKKYSGTYGTNGFYLPFTSGFNTTQAYAGSFSGSGQFLNVAASASLAPSTGDFTIEANVNFNALPVAGVFTGIFENQIATTSATNDKFWFGLYNSSGQYQLRIGRHNAPNGSWAVWTPTVGTWYHVAVVRQSGVISIYINGVSQTMVQATDMAHSFSQNGASFGAASNTGSPAYFNGYISNARYVVGSAVYTTGFTPPSSNLTNITNTQWLTLQNATIIDNSSAARTITNNGSVVTTNQYPFQYTLASVSSDYSGNNNNWTTNNINSTILGTTYDSMIDSPTNAAGTSTGIGNYATLNPLGINGSVGTFSNANLTWLSAQNAGGFAAASTIPANTGGTSKWYCEVTMGTRTSTYHTVGLSTTTNPWTSPYYIVYRSDGLLTNNGTTVGNYATFNNGDVIGMAFDNATGVISFYKNNTYIGQTTASLSYLWYFIVAGDSTTGGATYHCNFGQQPFVYTPPSGYKALNTYNLPAASISNGAKHFGVNLYTGTGATQSITNSGSFQPDLVWGKQRNGASSHVLTDSVRGTNSQLSSNLTNAQDTQTDVVTAFNSNGFTVGASAGFNMNQSGSTLVAWQWKGGGTAVTNNSGTISSQVSANTSAGFSIATFTGNAVNGATVGHGLGVTPAMLFVKNRSIGASSWIGWHKSISQSIQTSTTFQLTGYTGAIFLNLTNGSSTYGYDQQINGNGNSFVAYCWSEVAGYSKFGSYTGNGSADGPFIYTGFRPRFIMIKNATAVNNWGIIDTSRDTYNGALTRLHPNLSQADNTGAGVVIDVLSNGFKCRNSDALENQSGQTIIYAAFAEHPFNYSRAR